jgi:hypothetical protein
MRRGTSVSFWKNYENQQMRLVTSCMPKTVARGSRVVVPAAVKPTTVAVAARS